MKLFKRSFIVALATLSLICATGCISVDANGKTKIFNSGSRIIPSGKIVSKSYDMGTFSSINLNSVQDVVITQGKHNKVTVKGSDNLIPYCKLKNQGGTLVINLSDGEKGVNVNNCDLVVYVTMKDIESVKSSGTGDIKFKGSIRSKSLSLSVSGTSDFSLPVLSGDYLKVSISGTGDMTIGGKVTNARFSISGTGDISAKLEGVANLSASISGTGDMNLTGTTDTASYSVSGTGDIYAKNMIAKNVDANANGTGDITCYASESFTGSRSQITNITCYGKPKNRNFRTEGYSFP